MGTKFVLVVVALSVALYLAYLWGRKLRELLYWRALFRQLDHMTEGMSILAKACIDSMVSVDEFSGAILEVAEALRIENLDPADDTPERRWDGSDCQEQEGQTGLEELGSSPV